MFFVHVLANRNGTPAALLADGAGDAVALLGLFESDLARVLPAAVPCFVPAGLEPSLRQAYAEAGWKQVDDGAVLRANSPFVRSELPADVKWIDGDWYLAPPEKASGAQAASRSLALQLVQLVGADADTHEIEALLRQDVALSYHLLRLVNSLGVGGGRKVNSFAQAILILGRQQLRRWLNLMLFAARQGDVRSAMLLSRVAMRGRAIELLAKAGGYDRNMQEQGFMAGMFSLLGVLFGMPLAEVLAPLAISNAVRAALLEREGELGALLALVESAERGDFADVAAKLAGLQLDTADFNEAVLEAAGWMLEVVKETKGETNA
ncbi:EAL and HDOD domain-containing protein [Massilia sp. GCM10020059]|uniref:HDOD domain-containing protein n=1 Tax=Massilia agrisoli TaxID=2892444 RepID=A0ABS8IX55_9BURK|nr:HDOD domain-containing protein [Massilia agrisoli]MCC6071794.1 HDOD domain-containing protein [Massilia agrisoli]